MNTSKVDPVKEIKQLSDGGVDYSFEAIGNKQVLEQCFYCLAPRGICTLVGAIPTGQKVGLLAGHFYVEKQIRGCFMGSNRFHVDMPRYLDLYRQGQLNLDDMVSRRGHLEDSQRGIPRDGGGQGYADGLDVRLAASQKRPGWPRKGLLYRSPAEIFDHLGPWDTYLFGEGTGVNLPLLRQIARIE